MSTFLGIIIVMAANLNVLRQNLQKKSNINKYASVQYLSRSFQKISNAGSSSVEDVKCVIKGSASLRSRK
jgi:hypothetical protein